MEYISDRITLDEQICNGKPTIRGLRISVQTILEYLSAGDSKDEILYHYPDLEPEDIDACLIYASKLLSNKYTIKMFAA
jgi:uncharacterized protein (DUF433 family)